MSTPDTTGYNEAERQFHEKDQQALAALRTQLDARRAEARRAAEKAAHWMRCPKCGGQMKEHAMGSVMVDQCTACGGVYFDAGEFEALARHQKTTSPMLDRLFSWMPSWRVGSDARPS
jgi:uncharacterized protein with PIN domain